MSRGEKIVRKSCLILALTYLLFGTLETTALAAEAPESHRRTVAMSAQKRKRRARQRRRQERRRRRRQMRAPRVPAAEMLRETTPVEPVSSETPATPASSSGSVLAAEPTPTSTVRKAASKPAKPWLQLTPSFSLGVRNFDYQNLQVGDLSSYEASFAPLVGVRGEVFSTALPALDGFPIVSLRATYRQAVGFQSASAADRATTFGTTWNELSGGLAVALPWDRFQVGVSADYASLDFAINAPQANPLTTQIPDIAYRYVRMGADMSYQWSALSLGVGLAYRYVLGTGILQEQLFPNSTSFAFDGYLDATYKALDYLELLLAVHALQHQHRFQATPDAQFVADGAVDQYVLFEMGAVVSF